MYGEEEQQITLQPRNPWETIGTVLTDLIGTYLCKHKRPQLCGISLLTWTRVTEKVQLIPITALHRYVHLCDL